MKTLNKMKIKQMRASGFTLVEIMIVVAIIGMLIAVAVPNFSKMRKDAQKTDALQSDKNLVLSPDAEVDSKPALFIYADDVKCGHGATAGNIDQDTVFYMRSRGVDPETVGRLLIYGFASEIIDTVPLDELRNRLESMFLESLPAHTFEF